MTIRLAQSEEDLLLISEMNCQNLGGNLTSEEKEAHGFVSIPYPIDFLKRMNFRLPQIIATSGAQVAGYCLLLDRASANEVELSVPLYPEMDNMEHKNELLSASDYLIVGQVCVGKNFRGQSLSRDLYDFCQKTYSQKYKYLLTTVSVKNPRSVKAHQKAGFQIMAHQPSLQWFVVVWDWAKG